MEIYLREKTVMSWQIWVANNGLNQTADDFLAESEEPTKL